MTYGLTATGFTMKTFQNIRDEVDAYQRANISEGLLLSDDSDQGQVNASHCYALAELWELAQALYSAYDSDTANDWSLDQLASLTGSLRNKYSKTTVTGQVTLNPNKALPAGSIANLANRPNTRFVTLTTVPADPSGGSFDVVFEAETAGSIDVAIGQLTEINVAVSGWTAVTNAAAGATGSQPETDPVFRTKREIELSSSGSTNLDAIIAGVSTATNVVSVVGAENTTNTIVNGIPPKAVKITVRGGADADVAQAIYDEKAAGVSAFGSTLVAVDDTQIPPQSHNIGFTKATSLTFYCDISINVTTGWDGATSVAEVKALIAAYVNALGIGDDVIYDNVKAVIFDAVGVHSFNYCKIDFSGSPTGVIDLVVSSEQYATSDVANIAVVTVP